MRHVTLSMPRPMATILRTLLAIAVLMAVAPAETAAQTTGPVAAADGQPPLTARIDWRTGYDDNVFRSADERVSDVVSTLSGSVAARPRFSRVGLTISGAADWVHFERLSGERGANVGGGVKLDLLFNRFAPYVSTSYYNSRQRQNLEIDTRPRIEQSTLAFGGVLRVGGKTALDFSAMRALHAYDRRATADGVNLGDALNRSATVIAVSLRQETTPLTQVTVTAEAMRDDFNVAAHRSADNYRLTAGFESDGRLRGRAHAGLRLLTPHDPLLPVSKGFYLSVGTSATVMDRVQIRVDAERDVAPSYRTRVDYFEYYGYSAGLTWALGPSLRVSALAGQRRADYGAVRDESARGGGAGVDDELRYGSGISFQLGESMTVDVSGIYTERSSTETSRRFNGMSVTAGVRHVF
jgi:hypothetical protein